MWKAETKVTSNIGLDKVCDRSPQTLFKIKKERIDYYLFGGEKPYYKVSKDKIWFMLPEK